MYDLVVMTMDEGKYPILHWDYMKMHCVKKYEGGEWAGEIDLFVNDESTAARLHSDIDQNCGYIRWFKNADVEFYITDRNHEELRVVKPFVYAPSVSGWMLETISD